MSKKADVGNLIGKYRNWMSTTEYSDLLQERREKRDRLATALSREAIAAMSDIEVRELIADLWAFGGWGNKDYLADRLLKSTPIDELRNQLTELLWGRGTLGERYDRFDNNVKYLGPAAISELLSFVHPEECLLWNERTRTGLSVLGILPDLVEQYWISGTEYERACDEGKRLRTLMEGQKIDAEDLLEVDLFLYWLSVEHQEQEEPVPVPDYDFDHAEVQQRLLEVGQYLGFEAEKEVRIARGAQVDVVWTMHLGNLGVVKYVFEVQRAGSADSLLLNLQKARRSPGVQKGIVVSNTSGLDEVRGEAEDLGEDFSKGISYLEARDAMRMAEALGGAWQIINKLELVKPA